MRYLFILLLFITSLASGQGQALFFQLNGANKYCAAATDANACAFLTAARITSTTTQAAINTLVLNYKSNGLWEQEAAIYPFVSDGIEMARSDQHRYNLKDTALYKLTFPNGASHTAGGVGWDGSQYATTGLVPSSVLSLNNIHLTYYASQNEPAGYTNAYMGAYSSASSDVLQLSPTDGGRNYSALNNTVLPNGGVGVAVTEMIGFHVGSRTAATSEVYYRNGSAIWSANRTSGALTSLPIFLGAQNLNGTPSEMTTVGSRFASIGRGYTGAQVATLSTIVNQFQTALGRNVY